MDEWTYWICDFRTGVKILQVYPKASPFNLSIFPSGTSGTTEFNLGGTKLTREQWRDLTTPWARKIVISHNDVVVYDGVLNKVPVWDRKTTSLSITHVDIESGIFQARNPFGNKGYWADASETIPGRLVRNGLSGRAAAAALVQAGTNGPLNTFSIDALVLEYLNEAGDFNLELENYTVPTVSGEIDKVRNRDGGPDLFFEGRWSAAGVAETVLRGGSPASPMITGERFDYVLDAPNCSLTKTLYGRDGVEQYSGYFTLGVGMEADMKVGGVPIGAELPPIIPARDTTQSVKTEANPVVLSGYSKAAAAASYLPVDVWDIELRADDPVAPIEKLKRGSLMRIFCEGDLYIPDGWHVLRVVALSCDPKTNVVNPTVQLIGIE